MMNTITILAMLAILSGATLSITGFSVVSSVVAQEDEKLPPDDTGSISSTGNMTGGNVTGGNTTGIVSSFDGGDGGGSGGSGWGMGD